MQYPDSDWIGSHEVKDIVDLFHEGENKKLLLTFNGYLSKHTIDELCERYVQTFDFNDKTTLYVTYYQFQDQQERGAALVRLKELYQKAGLILNSKELPDYLPMILEFLAIAPQEYIQEMILILKDNLEKLYHELMAIESPYRYVVESVMAFSESILPSTQHEIFGGATS